MTIYETIKRRMTRSFGVVLNAGYRNLTGKNPSLHFNLNSGYSVDITFNDLSQLVKIADRYAASPELSEKLKDWRNL